MFPHNLAAEEALAAVGAVLRSIQVCPSDPSQTAASRSTGSSYGQTIAHYSDHPPDLEVIQDKIDPWPLLRLHAVRIHHILQTSIQIQIARSTHANAQRMGLHPTRPWPLHSGPTARHPFTDSAAGVLLLFGRLVGPVPVLWERVLADKDGAVLCCAFDRAGGRTGGECLRSEGKFLLVIEVRGRKLTHRPVEQQEQRRR